MQMNNARSCKKHAANYGWFAACVIQPEMCNDVRRAVFLW